jgi:isoamylase
MISHGDELGRSQGGNNNAYCHDTPLTWMDWQLTPANREMLEFTRTVIGFRQANAVLRRRTYFSQESKGPDPLGELTWLGGAGGEMTPPDWNDPANHLLGMLLRAEAADEIDQRGRRLNGGPILVLLNGGGTTKAFTLPVLDRAGSWSEVINTAHRAARTLASQEAVSVAAHSLVLLRYEALD